MFIAGVIIILAFAWMALVLFGHGYVNTVDHVSMCLWKHARSVEEMHSKRAEELRLRQEELTNDI